jgi:hypothetical protein
MALTQHCSVFASFHQDGINLILRHVMEQRPSLVNFGTDTFVGHEERMCRRINAHPEVLRRGNPLFTVEPPLPVPGTGGALGLEFCAQLVGLEVDFHPGNNIPLPSELNPPLAAQRLALRASFCAAIGCPHPAVLKRYELIPGSIGTVQRVGDRIKVGTGASSRAALDVRAFSAGADLRQIDAAELRPPELVQQEPTRVPGRTVTIPSTRLNCFCLDVVGVAHMERVGSGSQASIQVMLDGLEVIDIQPAGLENSLECYVSTLLRLVILPRLRIAMNTLVFELGNYGTLSPTPTSGAVPQNPSIANNALSVFIDLS